MQKFYASLDEYLWTSKWYPWFWDRTIGPFHSLRNTFRMRQEIKEKFGGMPKIGDIICNCKFEHEKIVRIISLDEVELEKGGRYSLTHCCDPVPHPNLEHP